MQMDASENNENVTVLLNEMRNGSANAAEQLFPIVYGELHELARACMRRQSPGHTLQTTALVNEAFLKLAGSGDSAEWEGRYHFMRVAARAMRSVLVDHARGRGAAKRGGGWKRSPLASAETFTGEPSSDLLALDEALSAMVDFDERKARIVEMRFFGGMTVEETAMVMNVSEATIKREWRLARAWLRRELNRDDEHAA